MFFGRIKGILLLLSPLPLPLPRLLLSLGILGFYASVSQAQSGADILRYRHDQIQQREDLRREDERRQVELERRRRIKARRPIIEPRPVTEPVPDELCFPIENIHLAGVTVYTLGQQEELLAPFQGQCIGKATIKQLLGVITQVYFEDGYITSRAYIGEQDLSSGTLRIQVQEGRLENIIFADPTDTRQAVLYTAFPSIKDSIEGSAKGSIEGELLNLRDLEQGLENINRLASTKATLSLFPGDYAGGSVVEVDYQTEWPMTARLSYDNSGQESTGERQAGMFFGFDNLMSINDYTYLSLQTDTADDSDGKKSESIAWHTDLPFGYWSLSLDASRFKYMSVVKSALNTFETSGKSHNYALSLSRVLFRNTSRTNRIDMGLRRRESNNYIEDVFIETSSRRLAIATLGFHHTEYFSAAQLDVNLIYHRGVKVMGSLDDTDFPSDDGPRAQFDKFTLDTNYRYNFDWLDTPLTYATRLNYQYSPDQLYGSEQISIGGQFTVRGYKEVSLSANSGGYWRNELAAAFYPEFFSGSSKYFFSLLKPFVAVDYGLIRDEFYTDEKRQKMSGWAVGLGLYGEHLSLDVTYSEPLQHPRFLEQFGGYAGRQVYFSSSVKF